MQDLCHTLPITIVVVALLGLGTVPPSHGQSVDVGADVVSRYVWRGSDFGESLSVQPLLEISAKRFTVGSWGSYAINPQSAGANEHDVYARYAVKTSVGTFTAGGTDYYFPTASAFFNFESDGNGAHQIEMSLSYTGPEVLPFTVSGAVFVYNEPEHSIYLEATYPVTVETVDLTFMAGGTPTESSFYETRKAGVMNLSLGASRDVPITATFSLPVQVRYVLNPYAEKTFFVFGVSL